VYVETCCFSLLSRHAKLPNAVMPCHAKLPNVVMTCHAKLLNVSMRSMAYAA